MKFLKPLDNFLRKLSTIKFIIIITIATFIISAIFGSIVQILNIENSQTQLSISKAPYIVKLVAVGIIAPLLETLVFQHGIIKLLRKRAKNNDLAVIFISALIFGLAHCYNVLYVIHTTLIGVLLAYSYIIYEDKKMNPFWVVVIIHSLRNSIVFVISHLF